MATRSQKNNQRARLWLAKYKPQIWKVAAQELESGPPYTVSSKINVVSGTTDATATGIGALNAIGTVFAHFA